MKRKTGRRGRSKGKTLTPEEVDIIGDFARDYTVQVSPSVKRTGVTALAPILGYDDRTQLSMFVNGSRSMDHKRWERFLVLILRSDPLVWRRLSEEASSETRKEMALAGLALYRDTPTGKRGEALLVSV